MPSHRDTARQFPWDRIPSSAGFEYYTGVAGFAAVNWTTLASYTVPAGRKAAIDAATMSVFINGVGGLNCFFFVRFAVTSGGVTYPILSDVIDGNVFGALSTSNVGQAGWARAGDVVSFDYRQTAAGPTAAVYAGCKITECQE